MYKTQRGLVPSVTSVFGIVLLTLGIFVTLNFAMSDIAGFLSREPFSVTSLSIRVLTILITMLFFLSPLWFTGAFLISVFPQIRLVENGVKYRSAIFTHLIKWSEIDHLLSLGNQYVALAINRRGFYFLNGLYFNKLVAKFIRHEEPVLLLAPGLEDRDALLREIANRIKDGAMRDATGLYT